MIRYESKESDKERERKIIGVSLTSRYKIDIDDFTLIYDPKIDKIVLTVMPEHEKKIEKFAKDKGYKIVKNKQGELVIHI